MSTLFFHSVLVYAGLVLLMRLTGKRQLGDLELSELIVTILISEIASMPITEPDTPALEVIVPVLTLVGMEFLLSILSLKSVRLRAILAGKPALLIVHGRIDQSQMRKNRITPDELTEALRAEGILDLGEVQYAILETSGKLNFIVTPEQRPVTAQQMGIETKDAGYPLMVVNNGRVLTENLTILGLDERWLMQRLRENGLNGPDDVYMMTADMAGGIYLSPREA